MAESSFREGLLWDECGYWALGTAGSDTSTPYLHIS